MLQILHCDFVLYFMVDTEENQYCTVDFNSMTLCIVMTKHFKQFHDIFCSSLLHD
jgi:hypothetical protein